MVRYKYIQGERFSDENRLIIDVFDECRKLYFAKSKTNKIKKQIGCKAFHALQP